MAQTKKPKITTGKDGGDDAYSWAVRVNGRVVFSGLNRSQLPRYRKLAEEGYRDSGIPAFRGPLGL